MNVARRFRATVLSLPAIAHLYEKGLRALPGSDSARIRCRHTINLSGSISLDKGLKDSYPNDSRWDYAIGYSGAATDTVHWVEVHPCSPGMIGEMQRKLQWLRNWIVASAPSFEDMPRRFIWLPAGAVSLRPGTRQYAAVAQMGLARRGSRLQDRLIPRLATVLSIYRHGADSKRGVARLRASASCLGFVQRASRPRTRTPRSPPWTHGRRPASMRRG